MPLSDREIRILAELEEQFSHGGDHDALEQLGTWSDPAGTLAPGWHDDPPGSEDLRQPTSDELPLGPHPARTDEGVLAELEKELRPPRSWLARWRSRRALDSARRRTRRLGRRAL